MPVNDSLSNSGLVKTSGSGPSSNNSNINNHQQNGNKKKYGKNLNNLIKPASAPPIPKNEKSSSRNGLLLLSTNKKSKGLLSSSGGNGNNSNNNSHVSSNNSSNSPLKINGRALAMYDNNALRTHDFLLNAVAGAAGVASGSSAVTPDAWGVAAAAAANQHDTLDSGSLSGDTDVNGSPTKPESKGNYGNGNIVASRKDELESQRIDLVSNNVDNYAEAKELFVHATNGYDRRPGNSRGSLWEPNSGNESDHENSYSSNDIRTQDAPDDDKAAVPVIQLSSYEDRSRGPANNSGPRMLYDPKSGCMVEVKPRGESSSSKPRKIVSKKSGKSKEDTKIKKDPKNARKGKKEKDLQPQSIQEVSILAKSQEAKRLVVNHKIPRTSGVLYARDSKGRFYCADGCDADLGYGSHSVPGGRVNNAKAFADYYEENKDLYYHSKPAYTSNTNNNIRDAYMKKNHSNENNNHLLNGLQTGFQLEEPPAMQLDWVKAGEKIELVCGEDDSPLLKPTAKEWAPSQAALEAAAAVVGSRKELMDSINGVGDRNSGSSSDADDNDNGQKDFDDDDDDDDDHVHKMGLGFDPTLDMDFVMHSPASSPEENMSGLDVDIDSLALGPRLYQAPDSSSRPKHLFAFSSGTWGNGQSAVTKTGDWGIPLSSDAAGKGILGSAIFPTEEKKDSSNYLSIPGTSEWATSLGVDLGGVSANGESGLNSAGD